MPTPQAIHQIVVDKLLVIEKKYDGENKLSIIGKAKSQKANKATKIKKGFFNFGKRTYFVSLSSE